VSLGIKQGKFKFDSSKPPHIERPRTIETLARAFRVVHDEAVARVARLQSDDWAREIRSGDGELWSIGNLLWRKLLMHAVHHRGQLTLLCRLAGGVRPGLFGRTREETPRGACRHRHGSDPGEGWRHHLVVESKMSARAASNNIFSDV
jgi:hypothetical protein